MLNLHNTLTRKTEPFLPQNDSAVSLYTCGPTVYSEPLVGNWVAYIRWDTLVRALQANGYIVNRVMNITDVGHLVSDADDGEDKMEKGARREGKTAWDVAKMYTESFLSGMERLNLLMPEHLPKATDYINAQIELVKLLESKGHTYLIEDGVYFDTTTFPAYADFAQLDLDEQQAGARVEHNQDKRNPSDFALWKLTPPSQTRDMEWESPWGKGFPGWHLECSAMAMKLLGETLDIHAGGIDHIPVHHTNEIAQSQAVTGKPLARFWLHANFITVNGTKISKSLGNGYTLDDLQGHGLSPLDFRMFVLQSHYRSASNFTWDNLNGAAARLEHWRQVARLRHQTHDTLSDDDSKDTDDVKVALLQALQAAQSAINEDLNTPEALRAVEDAWTLLEKTKLTDIHQRTLEELIEWIDNSLGLKIAESTPDITDDQKQVIIERQRARENNDWDLSDRLRVELEKDGVHVRDTAYGTIWY